MRVITLFVRHGTEKYPDAERQLHLIFERQLPTIERKTIVIDNSLPRSFEEMRQDGSILLGGDNSSWEFSAWDRALQFLGNEIWSYDLVHFVTSAFNTLYTAYLDRFDERLLRSIVGRPVCLGHIDCYNEAVQIMSFQSQHWIRTSFLFFPPAEVKMLRDLASAGAATNLFGTSAAKPFASNGQLSENYQRYILDWLMGRDIGQGSMWHSQIALDATAWPLFQAKATAIFNEHLLSIRLRAQSTRLIDVTWLASQLETRSASEVDWMRSWRNQLSERNVDKVSAS